MRKTKIICTLGPAVDSDEMVQALIENGMDAARAAGDSLVRLCITV